MMYVAGILAVCCGIAWLLTALTTGDWLKPWVTGAAGWAAAATAEAGSKP